MPHHHQFNYWNRPELWKKYPPHHWEHWHTEFPAYNDYEAQIIVKQDQTQTKTTGQPLPNFLYVMIVGLIFCLCISKKIKYIH